MDNLFQSGLACCRKNLITAFCLTVTLIVVACNKTTTTPRWFAPRAGGYNTGWLAAGGNFVGNPNPAWTFPANGPIFAAAVFGDDGTVYFGTCVPNAGKVFALNPANGAEKAEYTTGGCVLGVLVFNGTVYAASDKLYALDASLNPRWNHQVGASLSAAPNIYGSTLYVAANDQNLYAVDVNTGNELWHKPIGGVGVSGFSVPAMWTGPQPGNGLVIVGCTDHNVYAYDFSGNLAWKFSAGGKIYGSPAIDIKNGRVLVGTVDDSDLQGNVYSLDANTGTPKWQFSVPDSGVLTSPIVASGNVYFASDGGLFYGLDVNMSKLWDPPVIIGAPSYYVPTHSPALNISNNLVFAPAYHSVFLLNPVLHTQAKNSILDTDGIVGDASLGPDGLVVVGNLSGTLSAIR
jgi:outer membrane protein assembly factor BamB